MSTNQDVQTLEETLNRTDLGSIINENKKSVMIVGAIGIILIIGYVIFSQIQTAKQNEILNEVAALETTLVEPFLAPDGKMTAEEAVKKISEIETSLFSEPSIFPSMIAVLQKLHEEDKLTIQTLEQAQGWLNVQDKRSEIYLLSGLAIATLWEDQKQYDKALSIYSELIKRPGDLLKEKIFFHTGRMYLKTGNKEQGQKHFDFLFKEYENSQYAKLARLYLSE